MQQTVVLYLYNVCAGVYSPVTCTTHCLYLQDMYQRFLETGDDKPEPDVPKEEDPFWEPAEDVLIGTATAYLQSLLYALDFNDSLTVVDYKGQLTSEGQGSD